MTLIKNIVEYADKIAPFDTQADFDNSGLLVGDKEREVHSCMLCLDITSEVIDEAKDMGCELIISHHPVIFTPLSHIDTNSIVYKLIKADISALCLHTNLDKAERIGVNVCLSKALGLKNTVLYRDDYLCIGELENIMSDTEFATHVKNSLLCNGVRYTKGKVVKTVAVSSGGGSSSIELHDKFGFDAFVTGELKHHHFLYAKEKYICAVEAGHFNTEDVVISPLLEDLKSTFENLEFYKSEALRDPVKFV